jgi:hypothetical protein
VSPTASIRESKVRNKTIRDKSKIYKNYQNVIKIKKITKLPSKKVLIHENRLKNALFTANVILRFFLRKTKIFQKFIKPTKNFFWPKQKNMCFMTLNDKPNCQVSRILMNPRPILSDSSENDLYVIFDHQFWCDPMYFEFSGTTWSSTSQTCLSKTGFFTFSTILFFLAILHALLMSLLYSKRNDFLCALNSSFAFGNEMFPFFFCANVISFNDWISCTLDLLVY